MKKHLVLKRAIQNIAIAYAIVKVQNPRGISSFLRNKLRQQRQKGQIAATDRD